MVSTLPLPLPEPPTPVSLAAARARLHSDAAARSALDDRIAAAEDALLKSIAEQRAAIRSLEDTRAALDARIAHARGYLAPVRLLPRELLGTVFSLAAADDPACAWTLASVCALWRRLALGMPVLWSKIRLVTTASASADTVRLWLERAGPREPLDIEITLQADRTTPTAPRARARPSTPPHAHYFQLHHGTTAIQLVPAVPPSPPPPLDEWGGATPPPQWAGSPPHWSTPPPAIYAPPLYTPIPIAIRTPVPAATHGRAGAHWGHIAVFYLVEQMHRWRRFVFRFDKQFQSWTALSSIAGKAPLLEEFEVSCAGSEDYGDWRWLPSAPASTPVELPRLRTLTLNLAPFKWHSPMLRNNLRTLALHALPTMNIALDRVLHIVSANRGLERLSLFFASVLPPVLPLAATALPELRALSLGGHYSLATLLDHFTLPALEALTLDTEAHDALDDTLAALFARSAHPPVRALALGHGAHAQFGYYHGAGLVRSWAFLGALTQLRSLRVGAMALGPLFGALGAPDDDAGGGSGWLCPQLTRLALKTCAAHGEGVPKLVLMVEGRNPEGGGAGSGPARLKHLEIIECTTVGLDVVEWLRTRIDTVVCVEPSIERASHSPSYPY